ncbi:acyltransferase family protein [Psychrobacillus psychrodurans]|uniref:acyltransferase family protein n=1 Tax=Psychrobacillus TaxID=1221880 RepID=UPI001F4ECA89|nr:acyltransferase family protein [Psychrobacillus psychrodurans]MCK1998541.1 acyltransferase family protein [Psychrobacillus psychrodurans]
MIVNERLREIDIVRGITIFLVVLGHTGAAEVSEGLVSEILRGFRMPLFFMVSGYLFSSSKYLGNTKKLVIDKTRTLIIPYISFCFLSAGIWILLLILNKQEIAWGQPLIGMLYGNGNWIVENTPIWFLVCLFSAFIIFNIILKISIRLSLLSKTVLFIVLGVIGYGVSRIIWMPWSFDIALVALLFMYIGNILKEKRILYNHKMMLTLTSISLCMFIAVLIFNVPADMNNRVYGNVFLFYIGGISGSLLILFISKYLLTKVKLIYSVLSYLGRQSILILGLHFSVGFYFADWLAYLTRLNSSLFIASIAISISLLMGLAIDRIPIFSFLFKGTTISVVKISPISQQSMLKQVK